MINEKEYFGDSLVVQWLGLHTSIAQGTDLIPSGASLVVQTVNNLPAMQETWVQSLGWEDLEEGMATHSSILAWRIPMNREAWRATVHGVAKSRTRLSDSAQHRELGSHKLSWWPKKREYFHVLAFVSQCAYTHVYIYEHSNCLYCFTIDVAFPREWSVGM